MSNQLHSMIKVLLKSDFNFHIFLNLDVNFELRDLHVNFELRDLHYNTYQSTMADIVQVAILFLLNTLYRR